MSLVLWCLLQKLPGYTAETLLAEDAGLVDDWLIYLQEEAEAAQETNRG